MILPKLVTLGPDQAWNIIMREVGTGRKIYICRWGGLASVAFEGNAVGIFSRLKNLFGRRGAPVILITEQTVYQLTSSKPRSLFWWRYQLGLWQKLGEGVYGFERVG